MNKELLIKKSYADKVLMLTVEKAFREFMYHKKLVSSTKESMQLAKKLFIKESLTYELKKNNGKDLLEALFERVLAIKNHYTAVSNCNSKYIELLDLCGYDLSDLTLYE